MSFLDRIRELKDDLFALDAFIFHDEPVLSLHQRRIYKKFEQHRFRWLEAARGGAKSYTLARYNILRKLKERRKVIYSGPSYRQSRHPFRYEKALIFNSQWLPQVLASDPTENTQESRILFKNGAFSVALPASGSRIHGQRGNDLCLTEFFDYNQDLYSRSVRPMIAVAADGIANTVTWETTAGFEFQFAHVVRKQVLEKVAARDSNYCFIAFDLDDLKNEGWPMQWEVIEADRELDEDIFQQQYMNRWLNITGSFYEFALLKREELKRGTLLRKGRGRRYAAGLDVARSLKGKGDDSAFAVWEIPEVGPPSLIFVSFWNDITADRLAATVADLLKAFDISLLIMDFRGGGVAVYDKLAEVHSFVEQDDERPGRRIIEDFPSTPSIINEAHNRFRSEVRDGDVLFPARPEEDDEELARIYQTVDVGLKQFADLQTTSLPSGYFKFEAPSGRKKDIAYSILYGHHAARQLMRKWEAPPREHGSPIVTSDLSRVIYGDSFAPF